MDRADALTAFYESSSAKGIKEIIKASVAGNTFRAWGFRRWGIVRIRPSGVYRDWTTQRLTADEPIIRKLDTQEAMQAYVIRTAHDLDRHWRTEVANNLDAKHADGEKALAIGFGRAAKLLNLSLKHLLWLPWDIQAREGYIRALNVPLDSFTLQAIRLVCRDLRINEDATMKFVENEDQYLAIQAAIRGLLPAGYLPVHYELAIWNRTHPKVGRPSKGSGA